MGGKVESNSKAVKAMLDDIRKLKKKIIDHKLNCEQVHYENNNYLAQITDMAKIEDEMNAALGKLTEKQSEMAQTGDPNGMVYANEDGVNEAQIGYPVVPATPIDPKGKAL